MTLTREQKLGQLAIGQLASTSLTDEFWEFLRTWPLAGYRAHRSNIVSADQFRAYTRARSRSWRPGNFPPFGNPCATRGTRSRCPTCRTRAWGAPASSGTTGW